ncbi:transposable element Tcb1 transposase [Trichonephila clavipes]|nr:transposable element Tcb1 transposase [Trichonephila clavipes]
MDCATTSRMIAQQIQSVTHHSVSTGIIRLLQQSGMSVRYPLFRLPLIRNHGHLRRHWIRVWRHCGKRLLNCCVMHRHTGSAPSIMPIENVWSILAQRLTQDTPPAATPDQLWQYVDCVPPKDTFNHLFDSMPRRVAAVIANTGGYTNY